VTQYDAVNFTERDCSLNELRRLPLDRGVTWIDVTGLADASAISEIGELFGLHSLALEDVVHIHQRAKVEAFEDHLFIVARMVSANEELESEQVAMFLGPRFVVMFQERPGTDCLDRVRDRLRQGRGRIRELGADYLVYSLLDAIIDGYFPVLQGFGAALDELEDEIDERARPSTIQELHGVRKNLLLVRRIIWSHREAVNGLLRDDYDLIGAETQVFLRDCYDHTVQLLDVAEIYRETCADLRDLHYSQLSQRTNDVMKVLTIMSSLFIPLTFLAGLYGMNFDPDVSRWNMPELRWTLGYPFALGLMAVSAVVMLVYMARRGWLSQ
jgi:magnesium transporter